MCKYCEPIEETEYFVIYPELEDDETDMIYHKKTDRYMLRQGEMGHHSVEIQYCPWCGNKLK